MSDELQISELLRGYTIDKDNIQSVGNMTVLPIVSDTEFTNVADINEVTLKKDREYNRLEFQNASGSFTGIALQGWTIIDPQPAQDRTIPYAHLIKCADSKVMPANCVQSNQGGHFNTATLDQEKFMILPPSLREVALKKATYDRSGYDNLWSTLDKWCGRHCSSTGLKYFYSQFEDKLNQFVAQFEPVKNQLGAVVLINDQIVAIDIMPKYNTWKKVWKKFIRDSYGAEAVRAIETQGAVINTPMIDMEKIESLEDLENKFNDAKDQHIAELRNKLSFTSKVTMARSKLEQINELTMTKIESADFKGQAVYHGDHVVYLSLVTSKALPKASTKFKSLRNDPYKDEELDF